MRRRSAIPARPLLRSVLLTLLLAPGPAAATATLEVPAQYATIQAAIDAAVDGDVVRVAPGVYTENLVLSGKAITLASHLLTTGDRGYVAQTILDGGGGPRVIRIEPSTASPPTITGFTLRHATDGVNANGKFNFLDNRVTATGDGIDYESNSGGIVRGCVLEGNTDDGIDSDNNVTAVIEDNTIQNNGDDGIEIRMQSYTGPMLTIEIRDNLITGNGEDGIQLISYDLWTSRRLRIERNVIANNAMAGLGSMCCQNTIENFQGAPLLERVELFGNTFFGNAYGVTGGDSLIALNNIISGSLNVGLVRANAGSIAAYNLFHANGTDHLSSNVDGSTTVTGDPRLQADYHLGDGSPAIDAGTSSFTMNGEVVHPATDYFGAAPDLGAFETPDSSDVTIGGLPPSAVVLPPAPNPSRESIDLRVEVAVAGRIRLEIVDVTGRMVRLLADLAAPVGRRDFTWDGRDDAGHAMPAGVYHARLVSSGRTQSRAFARLR